VTGGIPLAVGPLEVPGFLLSRSGIRWLAPDGHRCRPNEVLAYCNIKLSPRRGAPQGGPFLGERRDLQLGFAATVAGTLRRAGGLSRGGFQDIHAGKPWSADTVLGTIEPVGDPPDGPAVRIALFVGRRATELAEDRSGLLTGWHARARASWVGDRPVAGTVLSLGICELMGVVRGERGAFLELLEALGTEAQVAFVPDDTGVPAVRTLLEQLRRTPAERDRISEDLMGDLVAGREVLRPADWMFAGAALANLVASPMVERSEVLTRTGTALLGPPSAVLVSLHAEQPTRLVHKHHGYHWHCHDFRVPDAGPATRAWMKAKFVPEPSLVEDVLADYRALAAELRARTGARLVVCNRLAVSGPESVVRYGGLPSPLGRHVAFVYAQELNVGIAALEREGLLSVLDLDAIAATLGTREHFRGVHASGAIQEAMRTELLRLLRRDGVPGFS
jgi:hypothetical protein